MGLGHTGEKFLQALAKQALLKGTRTCKLEFCEHCVIEKEDEGEIRNSDSLHQENSELCSHRYLETYQDDIY